MHVLLAFYCLVFHSFAQRLEELVNVVRKIRVDTETTVMLGDTAAVVLVFL